ncbi:hypothetical protein Zmor_022072 [Zophobas morio]|uniref:DNA (cytosine-5-)-methyltransferase n=1 Tax=Zophobas morio TaxID=2755281 RepID=A0AA38M064_9CUCU|nr:hypothetical protein Zmor_022072 [Zophobas morio]
MSNKIKGVSLFANVGIDEHYLKDANIEMKVSNELLEKRADFYRHLYPEVNMICGDITNKKIFNEVVEAAKKEKCNLLIATPPCQGMSIAGTMDASDPRNKLIKYVVKFARSVNTIEHVLIENVPGILKFKIKKDNGREILIKDYIKKEFELMGFNVRYEILDAADFKTPQHRRRAIFFMSKNGEWPTPLKSKRKTVEEAIGELPSLNPGETSHIKYHVAKPHAERHIQWMKNTPTGKSAHENQTNFPVKANGKPIKGYTTTYKRME